MGADALHHLDVLDLAVAPDIVALTRRAPARHIQRTGVVVDVEPIADVLSVP